MHHSVRTFTNAGQYGCPPTGKKTWFQDNIASLGKIHRSTHCKYMQCDQLPRSVEYSRNRRRYGGESDSSEEATAGTAITRTRQHVDNLVVYHQH